MGFIKHIKEEFQVIQERDPAIKTPLEVLLYPSFRVMIQYRKAHKLYQNGHYFLARWISQRAARKTGIEIHPGAQIGKGLFIDHGNGVIIGETAIIGDNVTLYQGVTLGGTGKETGKRHPTLRDNVMVSAGAKVIGSFTIGENSKIGAGSVVLEEVPPNCTVVGVPGRIVKRENRKVPRSDMDQIHLPDPVLEDIRTLQKENEALKSKLQRMEYQLQEIREEKEKNEMEKTLKITGMMCGHCEATVKKALEALDGVQSAEVSHEKGTAVVSLTHDVADADLKTAVEARDYTVTGIDA